MYKVYIEMFGDWVWYSTAYSVSELEDIIEEIMSKYDKYNINFSGFKVETSN